jgi:CheY-like chemotaxis protein
MAEAIGNKKAGTTVVPRRGEGMAEDDRDILEVLKSELDFIKGGGYGRSVRTPWKPTEVFRDSPSCLNFGDPQLSHPCDECLLMAFVPPSARSSGVPCHRIPLNAKGETPEQLVARGDQGALEEAVKDWLEVTIRRIEASRAQAASAAQSAPPQQETTKARRETTKTRRPRVLIVDDDEGILILLEHLLEDAGYDTTTAWTGHDAVRLLAESSFDLVLLDDYLSDISSEEVLRQLGKSGGSAPVLLLQSGTLPDELAVKYARLGVRFFISKHSPKEVAGLVDDYLGAPRLIAD